MAHALLSRQDGSPRAWVRPVVITSVLLIASACVDTLLWRRASVHDPKRMHLIEISGWYQSLRQMGYVPVWLAVGLAIDLAGRRRSREGSWDAAPPVTLWLLLSVIIAGAAVEILKPSIGRLRPEAANGAHRFVPFWMGPADAPYSTPSSHAAIAFAGAFALARTIPGTGVVVIPLAVGCGVTRLIAGAHFASDIVLAGAVGWCASLVAPRRTAS